MADRISISLYNSKDEVFINTRKVSLLELLLVGELSYINDFASFDPEIFKSILEKLDTEQVSTN